MRHKSGVTIIARDAYILSRCVAAVARRGVAARARLILPVVRQREQRSLSCLAHLQNVLPKGGLIGGQGNRSVKFSRAQTAQLTCSLQYCSRCWRISSRCFRWNMNNVPRVKTIAVNHTCQDLKNTLEYVNHTSDDRNANNSEYPCCEMSGRIGGHSASQVVQAVSRGTPR